MQVRLVRFLGKVWVEYMTEIGYNTCNILETGCKASCNGGFYEDKGIY